VERPGHEVLARSAFPFDQHRCRRVGDPPHHRHQRLYGRVLTDDVGNGPGGIQAKLDLKGRLRCRQESSQAQDEHEHAGGILDEAEVIGIECRRTGVVFQIQRSDGQVSVGQRHGENRPDLKIHDALRLFKVGMAGCIVQSHRLAAQDAAQQGPAKLVLLRGQDLGLVVPGGNDLRFTGSRVPEQDEAALGAGLYQQGVQERVATGGGRERLDRQQGSGDLPTTVAGVRNHDGAGLEAVEKFLPEKAYQLVRMLTPVPDQFLQAAEARIPAASAKVDDQFKDRGGLGASVRPLVLQQGQPAYRQAIGGGDVIRHNPNLTDRGLGALLYHNNRTSADASRARYSVRIPPAPQPASPSPRGCRRVQSSAKPHKVRRRVCNRTV